DQSLVNCAQPVAELTSAMLRARDRNFSLCLYGPPGTGKSAYARYLAASLGMEVLVRRASDLLGMFVGQSEHNIAAMFAEAVDRKAFLIVDEADSLLRERGAANHSWEVTQVNEMLTWMEQHPLPYAFTTNLMDGLDRAAMRRFTFKARFDYLLPGQTIHAFRHFLHAEPPAEITRLDRLTPGDFRVVKARAEILEISDPQRLLNMLREEVALKRDGAARAIGFAPAVQQ
ncbi:MAG: ATP-binding protein, partial [Gammaproteobacteria bacterium]